MKSEIIKRPRIVGHPVLCEIREHCRIETASAACTSLEHDIRMRFYDTIHYAVKPEYISVGYFTLTVTRECV